MLARRQPSLLRAKNKKQTNMPAAKNTIDMTPTWESVLNLLLSAYQNKNSFVREEAYIELTRMAKMADAYVASQKEKKISG